MLAKLSFRNAKRQAHDYIIYFVTLTAIFSLIHGLNSLLFAEDDIFPLDDSTFILPMILISSLLFSISLWLTSYMTNFILKRRSKEISIYITLGMEPYQISKVFTLWCCTIKVDIENSKGQYIEKDKQEATKDGSESTKIQHGI